MNNNKKNINWINLTKALCLIFVFLRHCENYYGCHLGWFDRLFLTFYVNAFFFVSGYLLFWKQLSSPKIDENRNRYLTSGGGRLLFQNIIYRIVIPSIIFSAIEFFPSCIIQGRGIDIGFALYKTIGGGTYWFTSALVVAELILLALLCTRKRNVWFYAAICLIVGIIGMVIVGTSLNGLKNIWAWKQGLIALVFLAMGGLYWRYEMVIEKQMRWWLVALLMVVYVVVVLCCDHNNPLISTLQIEPLGFVTSAMACLLLVWLCKKLPEVKSLTFIGQNSLGFYFMSGALPISFSLIAHKLMPGSTVWMMLLVWVACMVVAYLAVKFINRWLPWVWDLRTVKTIKSLR